PNSLHSRAATMGPELKHMNSNDATQCNERDRLRGQLTDACEGFCGLIDSLRPTSGYKAVLIRLARRFGRGLCIYLPSPAGRAQDDLEHAKRLVCEARERLLAHERRHGCERRASHN